MNDAPASLDAEFAALYTGFGRPSIAPERLIRASLLQILFSVRFARQLMEQMNDNLLFRWFVCLGIDDPVWVPTVFTKNRDRLLTTDMSRKVMAAILPHPDVRPLLSDEHFSVDGTLVKAWALLKSFQPKDSPPPDHDDDPGCPPPPSTQEPPADIDQQPQQTETQPMPDTLRQTRNAEVNFRGEKRSTATHASVTDPDARLYKKSPGAAATLCFMGHTLMEKRNGLVVQAEPTPADGHGERKAALAMINRNSPGSTRRLTLGADKGYDNADFVADLRRMVVTPHVAHKARHSAVDAADNRAHIVAAGTTSFEPDFFSSLLKVSQRINDMCDNVGDPSSNAFPTYLTSSVAVYPTASNNFTAQEWSEGRINVVNCASTSGQLSISNNEILRNGVLVTNCRLSLGQGVALQDVIVLSLNRRGDSVTGWSGVRLGINDDCAAGGDAQSITTGAVSFPSGLSLFGARIIAEQSVSFTAQSDAVQGASILSNGEISDTANGQASVCGVEGMPLDQWTRYFRLAA